jgi:hypothetical protein
LANTFLDKKVLLVVISLDSTGRIAFQINIGQVENEDKHEVARTNMEIILP